MRQGWRKIEIMQDWCGATHANDTALLRRILDIVEQNQDQLLAEWDKYYPER
jgi:hypothetical protein